MIRPKGLGRGLDALLSGGNEDAPRDALQTLAVNRIRPGKYQPRTRMDETASPSSARRTTYMATVSGLPSSGFWPRARHQAS